MVKNLRTNCQLEKYYLDRKLLQEEIAWKIDHSKLHIWMLVSNGHLEQILKLV